MLKLLQGIFRAADGVGFLLGQGPNAVLLNAVLLITK